MHLIHIIFYATLSRWGYGLYFNKFLISLYEKDRDIFCAFLSFFTILRFPIFALCEAFSISLPKSWSELSNHQLRFFFRQVARKLPMNEVLALCVCKWAEIVVLCHANKHSCLVKDRKSKHQVVLADWQITFAARQLVFLGSFAPQPVRISVICGASAVNADLQSPSPLRTISLARTITKVFCIRKAWNALQRWRICFIRN